MTYVRHEPSCPINLTAQCTHHEVSVAGPVSVSVAHSPLVAHRIGQRIVGRVVEPALVPAEPVRGEPERVSERSSEQQTDHGVPQSLRLQTGGAGWRQQRRARPPARLHRLRLQLGELTPRRRVLTAEDGWRRRGSDTGSWRRLTQLGDNVVRAGLVDGAEELVAVDEEDVQAGGGAERGG